MTFFLVPDPALPAGYSWIPIVIPIIIALFSGTGFVAWRRLRTEGPKIIIEAAQGAVIVQSGVIEDLRDQIADLRLRLDDALKLQARVRQLEQSEEELQVENTRLKSEVRRLKERVTELEEA